MNRVQFAIILEVRRWIANFLFDKPLRSDFKLDFPLPNRDVIWWRAPLIWWMAASTKVAQFVSQECLLNGDSLAQLWMSRVKSSTREDEKIEFQRRLNDMKRFEIFKIILRAFSCACLRFLKKELERIFERIVKEFVNARRSICQLHWRYNKRVFYVDCRAFWKACEKTSMGVVQ